MGKANGSLQSDQTHLVVQLSGDWSIDDGLHSIESITQTVEQTPRIKNVSYQCTELGEWDSSLIVFLRALDEFFEARGINQDRLGIAPGVLQLLELASAVPKLPESDSAESKPPFFDRVGTKVLHGYHATMEFMTFWGEALLASARFFRGKAIYRKADLIGFVRDAGPGALGIVTLISILVGSIIAFVGAVQLEKFSAGIYISSMIGFAIPREMGAMMTAIIMSGRTGAAYAAQLGSMQVNEEIDALTTMGVSPFDFLVLPRMMALIIMMPLLTIYADVIGILGGAITSIAMLDITFVLFWDTMVDTVSFRHVWIGLLKSFFFGILVALAGCYMGMKCGRSATAVGQVTTQSVVLGIVLIIVFDSIINFIGTVLNY